MRSSSGDRAQRGYAVVLPSARFVLPGARRVRPAGRACAVGRISDDFRRARPVVAGGSQLRGRRAGGPWPSRTRCPRTCPHRGDGPGRDAVVVVVRGVLDLARVADVVRRMDVTAAPRPRSAAIVCDLAEATSCDADAVGALARVALAARRRGLRLWVRNPRPELLRRWSSWSGCRTSCPCATGPRRSTADRRRSDAGGGGGSPSRASRSADVDVGHRGFVDGELDEGQDAVVQLLGQRDLRGRAADARAPRAPAR